jgi:hypothetical protein
MVGGIDRSRPVGPVHLKMVESLREQTLDQPSPSSSPTLRHARGDRRSFLSRLRQRRGIQCFCFLCRMHFDRMKYIHFGVTQSMTCPQFIDLSHSLTSLSRVVSSQSLPRIQSKTIAAQPCDSVIRASIDSGFFVRLASDSFTQSSDAPELRRRDPTRRADTCTHTILQSNHHHPPLASIKYGHDGRGC